MAAGLAILIAATVMGAIRHGEIKSWPHVTAKAYAATPVSQKGTDAYGIRYGIEYDYKGTHKKDVEPETFDGAFHKIAARADEMNTTGSIPIILNPARPTDEGFTMDNYLLPFFTCLHR